MHNEESGTARCRFLYEEGGKAKIQEDIFEGSF